jgi:hypothetical protein
MLSSHYYVLVIHEVIELDEAISSEHVLIWKYEKDVSIDHLH